MFSSLGIRGERAPTIGYKLLFFGLEGRTDAPAVSLKLQEWVRDN